VREWTAVKIRWSLRVDRAEKRALVRRAGNSRNVMVKVREAHIRTRSGGDGTGDGAGAGGGATDPRLEYCYQAQEAGYGPTARARTRNITGTPTMITTAPCVSDPRGSAWHKTRHPRRGNAGGVSMEEMNSRSSPCLQ
jgi:hypothetical protein